MITTDYNNSFCKIQYFNSINNGKSSNPIAYNKLIKFLFSSFSAILAQSWFLRIMFSFCSRADLSSISPASLRILSFSGPPSMIWSMMSMILVSCLSSSSWRIVGSLDPEQLKLFWSSFGWHQDHRKRLKKFYSKFSYLNWISSISKLIHSIPSAVFPHCFRNIVLMFVSKNSNQVKLGKNQNGSQLSQ